MSSLQSAMQILKMFGSGYTSVRLPEITEELRISKSTAWRLLDMLVDQGMLRKTDTSEFHVGPRAMALGHLYLEQNPMTPVIRHSVRRLHQATGCTSYAIRWDRDMALTLDIVPASSDPMEQIGYVGERRMPWVSASGRLMLAHMPEDEAYGLLSAPLQRSWRSLSAELHAIRLAKVSLLENSRTPGYMSAAVLTEVAGQDEMHALSIFWDLALIGSMRQRDLIDMLRVEAAALAAHDEQVRVA